jgi:hypothetical protein
MSVCREDELAAVRTLLDGIIERIPKMTPFPLDTSERKVLAGMAGTAFNRLGAIRALFEIGAIAETAILARSLIELQISANYLVFGGPDCEDRARRFLMFEAVQRSKTVDRVLDVTTGAGVGIVDMLSQGKERLADLRCDRDAALTEYGDMEKSPRGWAGISYAEMIRAVDNRVVKNHLYFVYRQVYFSFSEFAHPTPTAIRHAIPGADPGGTLLPFGVPIYSAMAAGDLFSLAARAGGVSAPSCDDLLSAFERAMPAEMTPRETA